MYLRVVIGLGMITSVRMHTSLANQLKAHPQRAARRASADVAALSCSRIPIANPLMLRDEGKIWFHYVWPEKR